MENDEKEGEKDEHITNQEKSQPKICVWTVVVVVVVVVAVVVVVVAVHESMRIWKRKNMGE